METKPPPGAAPRRGRGGTLQPLLPPSCPLLVCPAGLQSIPAAPSTARHSEDGSGARLGCEPQQDEHRGAGTHGLGSGQGTEGPLEVGHVRGRLVGSQSKDQSAAGVSGGPGQPGEEAPWAAGATALVMSRDCGRRDRDPVLLWPHLPPSPWPQTAVQEVTAGPSHRTPPQEAVRGLSLGEADLGCRTALDLRYLTSSPLLPPGLGSSAVLSSHPRPAEAPGTADPARQPRPGGAECLGL